MTKIDPYKHKEKYFRWKEEAKNGLKDLSPQNEQTLLKYIDNMETGLNVAQLMKKGPRSFIRLNALRIRIAFLMRLFQEKSNLNDITKITEEQLHLIFGALRNGSIRKSDGKVYQSAKDYAVSQTA